MGELLGDSLGQQEQDLILRQVERDLPAHDASLHKNKDGITWAVIAPPSITPELLRFTICRVEPGVMVMIEDEAARRQFRGVSSVAEALDFVRLAATEAMHAANCLHVASRVLH